jgi:hypothetical protein
MLDDFFGNRNMIMRTEFVNRMIRERGFSSLLDTALIRKRLEEAVAGCEKQLRVQVNEIT